MTQEQLEVINLLNNINLVAITDISAEDIFINKNSKAFDITFFDDNAKKTNAVVIIDRSGKISFYDRPIAQGLVAKESSELKHWSKERSIELCSILGLPERLIEHGPKLLSIKNLTKFFIAANRPDDSSDLQKKFEDNTDRDQNIPK